MTPLLALAPLLLVLALLASGRASALAAGLAGLAATLLVALPRSADPLTLLQRELPAGLWLAWIVIAIVVSGVLFHRAIQARGVTPASASAPAVVPVDARALWPVCFLLAPFAESVTGFGVGYIIALAALQRLGVAGLPALLLGLYSQSLVPWGALAVGTTVGAAFAGLPVAELGLRSAALQAPIHALYLLFYWRLAAAGGIAVSARQKLDDGLWTVALLAGVAAANRWGDAEIGAAAPTALLLALRFWRDRRPDLALVRATLASHAPYVLLTLVLCALRLVPPLRDLVKPLGALKPFADLPAFAPFHAPGFWLLTIGLATAVTARQPLARLLRETAAGAWRAVAVTLAFVLMAQLYVGAGLAQSLADAAVAAVGRAAALGVPAFAAMGGFLTGSGASSNAMLIPMEMAIARASGLDAGWIAAVQNAVTANLTMLSPIRVSMGAAILALAGAERAIYRRAWPLALPPLLVGLGMVALLLA